MKFLKKFEIYTDGWIRELETIFPGTIRKEDDKMRIIYGNYLQNGKYYKRPLAKLTKDILGKVIIKTKK